eukprot:357771-Chlamydomonas_euryale.AAC.2
MGSRVLHRPFIDPRIRPPCHAFSRPPFHAALLRPPCHACLPGARTGGRHAHPAARPPPLLATCALGGRARRCCRGQRRRGVRPPRPHAGVGPPMMWGWGKGQGRGRCNKHVCGCREGVGPHTFMAWP